MEKKLKIAHITATFPPYQAGTGNVCYYNARELARRGHDVHVYTAAARGAPAEEKLDGFQVHRLKPFFQIGNAPFLPGLLMPQGFDLLHLHYPFIFGAEFIGLVSRFRRMPLVLTYHNDLIGDGRRRWLFQTYARLTAPWVFTGARQLIPVSCDYAEHSRIAPLFRRHPGVTEVPNGVDPDLFVPYELYAAIKQQLGIPKNAKVLLFVAALDRAHYFKGLEILLQALAEQEFRDLHLLVIGDGELRSYYETLAARLKLQSQTHFAGKIAHTDLPQYLSVGDFLVLPSSPPESFGLVLVEALACGTPVIASDLPGVRTVVAAGVDGLLVPPGDVEALAEAIHTLLAMPAAQRREMGAAGRRKVVERYTWELAGEKLEAIYTQVTGER